MQHRRTSFVYSLLCLITIITDHHCRGDENNDITVAQDVTNGAQSDPPLLDDTNNGIQLKDSPANNEFLDEPIKNDNSKIDNINDDNSNGIKDILSDSQPITLETNDKNIGSIENTDRQSISITDSQTTGTSDEKSVIKSNTEYDKVDDSSDGTSEENKDNKENSDIDSDTSGENQENDENSNHVYDTSGENEENDQNSNIVPGADIFSEVRNNENIDSDNEEEDILKEIDDNKDVDYAEKSEEDVFETGNEQILTSSDDNLTEDNDQSQPTGTVYEEQTDTSISKTKDNIGESSESDGNSENVDQKLLDQKSDTLTNDKTKGDHSESDESSDESDTQTTCKDTDIIFVVDTSENYFDNQLIRQIVSVTSKSLVYKYHNARIGAVFYSRRIEKVIPLSSNITALLQADINNVPSTAAIKPYLGILAARSEFTVAIETQKVIVFITSGLGQYAKLAIQQAKLAKKDGIKIMVLGYKDGVIENDLENVASGNMLYLYDSAAEVSDKLENLPTYICKAAAYVGGKNDRDSDSDDSSKSSDGSSDSDDSESNDKSDNNDSKISSNDDGSNSSDNVDKDKSDTSDTDSDTKSSDDTENSKDSKDSSDSDDSDSSEDDSESAETPEDICKNSKMVHGVGYKRHRTDCDKFIQCFFDEFGRTRASVQTCPYGDFWDHDSVGCIESNKANCPDDPCKVPALFNRPRNGSCRSYWSCQNSKSVIMCCPENMSYQSMMGCVEDLSCTEQCSPNDAPEYGACDKLPLYGKPNLYRQWIESGHWVEMLCAPGTLFDENDCGCTMRTTYITSLGERARVAETCRPELYLPFCQGVKDWSGKNTLVQNEEDRVLVSDGKAYFNGESSLFIPRFAGATYGETIYIKLRYKPDFTKTEDNDSDDTDSNDDSEDNRFKLNENIPVRRKRRDTDSPASDGETVLSESTRKVSISQPTTITENTNNDILEKIQDNADSAGFQNTDLLFSDLPDDQGNMKVQTSFIDDINKQSDGEDDLIPKDMIVKTDFNKEIEIGSSDGISLQVEKKSDDNFQEESKDFSSFETSIYDDQSDQSSDEHRTEIKDEMKSFDNVNVDYSSDGDTLLDSINTNGWETGNNDNQELDGQWKDWSDELDKSAKNQDDSINGGERTMYSINDNSNNDIDTSENIDFETRKNEQDNIVNDINIDESGESENGNSKSLDSNPNIYDDVENKLGMNSDSEQNIVQSKIENDADSETNEESNDSGMQDNKSDTWMNIISETKKFGSSQNPNTVFANTILEGNYRNNIIMPPVPPSLYHFESNGVQRERKPLFNGNIVNRFENAIDNENSDTFYIYDSGLPNELPETLDKFDLTKRVESQQDDMALLSNGYCEKESACLEDPSLSIGTGKNSTHFTVYASESKKTQITLHKNVQNVDGWRTVLLTINQGVFRVFDEKSSDFEPVSGPVKTTFSGIYIGKGTGMNNFKGYIDEVYIYLCQPEDLDNFKSSGQSGMDDSNEECDYLNKDVVKHYMTVSSEESDSQTSRRE